MTIVRCKTVIITKGLCMKEFEWYSPARAVYLFV